MSQSKNETPALITALVVTLLLVGGAGWWLKSSGLIGGGSASVNQTSASNLENPVEASTDGSQFSTVAVPAGTFAYGGSTSWAPLRGTVDPLIQQTVPSFQLAYKDASGSSAGIQMLIDGKLDFAQSSRPLNSAEKRKAQQMGVELKETAVALEAVAIALNPSLNIPGLTLSQLKDIYTGKATNWNQFGGPDLLIQPASRAANGGTVQFFQEDVLNGEALGSSVTILGSTTEALRFVSNSPGAIYFASAPEIVGQCTVTPLAIGTSAQQLIPPYQQPYVPSSDCPTRRNQLNLNAFQSQTYPLLRPLYVVMRQDDSLSEQAGTAYADLLKTGQGQALLLQSGFVPLP